MSSDERWLAAAWPFVRDWLPAVPGAVVEIGCGPLGGFVPMLRSAGYDASGVDPEAPDGPWYHQVEFERYEPPGPGSRSRTNGQAAASHRSSELIRHSLRPPRVSPGWPGRPGAP